MMRACSGYQIYIIAFKNWSHPQMAVVFSEDVGACKAQAGKTRCASIKGANAEITPARK